jgi:methionyl-tRNA synthetase
MNNTIITCALPYANGNLHLGHFFEATLADIQSRYLTNINQPHIFISGNDCHGAATTLYCHKHNLDIQTHLASQHELHKQSYKSLKIGFTKFSQTNSNLHKIVVGWCLENVLNYQKKSKRNILATKKVLSWYDSTTEQFLPDRYVVGECPNCHASNQHPEICEDCNHHIEPELLISPKSVLSQQSVVLKESEHLTLNTEGFYNKLIENKDILHPSIKAKLLDGSLEDKEFIDISRDSPYYGIPINLEPFPQLINQFYYVWFDAPIGYLTFSFEYWLEGKTPTKELFNHYLKTIKFQHFIGKDIVYFHTYLWINLLDCILQGANVESQVIEKIFVHGWLTLDQQKFSKSKGHFFDLSVFSDAQIEALRLYFFAKYDSSIHDIEFSEKEIYEIYNNVIVNGVANFYARTIKLANKFDIKIVFSKNDLDSQYQDLLKSGQYKKLYELLNTNLAQLNSDFQEAQLWKDNPLVNKSVLLQIFLNRWYSIFQIYSLVCPSLVNGVENIENNIFFHIGERLLPFSFLPEENKLS